jgi:hypothetical protein
MSTITAPTETVAHFHCAKCGVRALFVGPPEKVYPAHTELVIEHAREQGCRT